MPESAADAIGQKDAVSTLGVAVAERWPGTVALSEGELIARFPKRGFIAGFRLPLGLIPDKRLLLMLPAVFPYALPRVGLDPAPPVAAMPHVEQDGVLCLVNGGSFMELPADIRHAEFVVDDAIAVCREAQSGELQNDFLDEAHTYWCLELVGGKQFWLALDDYAHSRLVQARDIGRAVVFAEDEAALAKWCTPNENRRATGDNEHAGIIHVPFPIVPEDYPRNSRDLVALAERAGQSAVDVLASLLEANRVSRVILAFRHNGEFVPLGLSVSVGARIGTSEHAQLLWYGYRRGRVPKLELLSRIATAEFPVQRAVTTRVGATALLHRTTGTQSDTLANVSVAIIGCGALGGTVANLLAQAGVRRLALFDGDILSWQNVGRHVLGGNWVGMNKAEALRADTLNRFHEFDVTAVPSDWQEAWKSNPEVFDKHDLVLSLTGDWASDCLLNHLSKQGTTVPPAIFGWVEAHALAGHAIAVVPGSACLRCCCNAVGEFRHSIAVVPKEHTLRREQSCGTFYQPFSALASAPTAALVARVAIDALIGKLNASEHRAWVGSTDDFDAVKALVTPQWADRLATNGYERVYRMPLLVDRTCPICGRPA